MPDTVVAHRAHVLDLRYQFDCCFDPSSYAAGTTRSGVHRETARVFHWCDAAVGA
jgi:hypothetical protein